MNFAVPCETYSRLATLARYVIKEDAYVYFQSVFLQNVNGKAFAIATNVKFAVVEYLGPTNEPDGCCALSVEDNIFSVSEKEKAFGSTFFIVNIPELNMSSLKSSLGLNVANVTITLPDDHKFADWRKWFPDKIAKSPSGFMYFGASDLAVFAASAPSGFISFPEFIDTSKPVVVRDVYNDKWLGTFLARTTERKFQPAVYPEWFK